MRHRQLNRCRAKVVRITQLGALLVWPTFAFAGQDGSYCTIPKLLPGVPAHVTVENIKNPFCGVALIEGRYQKLADITERKDEGLLTCSDHGKCQKTVKYFQRNAHQEPFIIIFTQQRLVNPQPPV